MLHGLRPAVETFEDGQTEYVPMTLPLSKEARERCSRWVDDLGEVSAGMPGPLAAAAAKIEGTAGRLALTIALVAAAERGRGPRAARTGRMDSAQGRELHGAGPRARRTSPV
jgi:hypothetical protein